MAFDPALPYEKHPQVAIRPEDFGALAYHYGTRRLVFLKSPDLATLVDQLAHHPTAADALAAHVPAANRPACGQALSALLTAGIIRPRAQ